MGLTLTCFGSLTFSERLSMRSEVLFLICVGHTSDTSIRWERPLDQALPTLRRIPANRGNSGYCRSVERPFIISNYALS